MRILIELRFTSQLGFHDYLFPAFLEDGLTSNVITFKDLVKAVVETPSLVGELSPSHIDEFTIRVAESHTNTQNAINARADLSQLFESSLTFTQAEQGLLSGHSMHPAPKSRQSFNCEDDQRYTPDFQGNFPLRWFAVDKSLLISKSAGITEAATYLQSLIEADPMLLAALPKRLPDNYAFFPMHPWQAEVLRKHPDVKTYIEQQRLIDLGEQGAIWYPTSSTRALYSPSLPYMLKFSLSVKLTNSIRHMSEKELARGLRLKKVFDTGAINEKQEDLAHFTVMHEPAYFGLHDSNNQMIDASLVAFRENPLQHHPGQEAVVLATLCQQHPLGEHSLLASTVHAIAERKKQSVPEAAINWLKAYCLHVLKPLFILQANHGIVLLAHQQNIVMKLDNGLPAGMFYRDCQGTAYTEQAWKSYSSVLPDDPSTLENFWPANRIHNYFIYYVIINSTWAVVASLAVRCGISEYALLNQLRSELLTIRQQVKDKRCLDFLLTSPELNYKGNFFVYLQGLNENTLTNPETIYFATPNPLIKKEEYRETACA